VILFERKVSSVLAGWIAMLLAISIVCAIDFRGGGDLYARLALIPSRVLHGELWRLVTWAFVELSPSALIITCVTIFWFGGPLLEAWGDRKLVRVFGAITVGAAVGTTVLATALGMSYFPYISSWAIADAIVIAWGLTFPTRMVRVYMLIAVSGDTLANFTLAFTGLCALFYGLVPMLPMTIAAGASYAYVKGWPRPKLRSYRGGKPTRGPYAPN